MEGAGNRFFPAGWSGGRLSRAALEVVDERGGRDKRAPPVGSVVPRVGWGGEPPRGDGVPVVADERHDPLGAGGVAFVNGRRWSSAR